MRASDSVSRVCGPPEVATRTYTKKAERTSKYNVTKLYEPATRSSQSKYTHVTPTHTMWTSEGQSDEK